jgi:hypothetical protein
MPSEPAPVVVIRPPGREPYAVTLDRLTALVRAARVLRMGRLSGMLGKALDAKARLEMEVEKDVERYVDRVAQVSQRKDEIFMKQHAALDVDVSDLAELERDLEDFGKNERSGGGANAYAGTSPPKL